MGPSVPLTCPDHRSYLSRIVRIVDDIHDQAKPARKPNQPLGVDAHGQEPLVTSDTKPSPNGPKPERECLAHVIGKPSGSRGLLPGASSPGGSKTGTVRLAPSPPGSDLVANGCPIPLQALESTVTTSQSVTCQWWPWGPNALTGWPELEFAPGAVGGVPTTPTSRT